MRQSISNDFLSIAVTDTGAELCSLVKRTTGEEYIWQADPQVWGSHAPVLFPIIGSLKGAQTLINGQSYRIPKHGLLRNNDQLELHNLSADRLTYRLCWSEQTLRQYPYRFEFRITYRLRNEHVIVYHEIENKDEQPMYFHLGGHPAFRVPFRPGEAYNEHFLRFEQAEQAPRYFVMPDGTISAHTAAVPWQEAGILPLTHDLFADDALVFKHLRSRSVILESARSGPILKMDYAGWTHFGVWAKPNGDFVCLEPWIGLADAHEGSGQFLDKEGLIRLDPGQRYEMSYDLKIF